MQYATKEEATTFYSKVYNSEWQEILEENKNLLLENASLKIDSYEYSGRKKDPNQEGEFPRVFCDGTESDDRLVKRACILEALRIYKSGDNGVGISTSGNLKSFKIGDVNVDLGNDNLASATDSHIDNVLGRYLVGESARILL